MTLSFDRATPVLDFEATAAPLKMGPHRWLLWPALAYKVVVPAPRNSAFNLFQRAVLEMCRAGMRTKAQIKQRLALPEELVEFVLEQLFDMGMLDERAIPTVRALRLLVDEDAEPAGAEDAGYVFVDGVSHRPWPRVWRGSLPVVELSIEADGQAKLERGTDGVPDTIFARFIWPNPEGLQGLAPPPNLALMKTARAHQRRAKAYARECRGAAHSGAALAPDRIRLVGLAPEPVFVAACIFLPKDTPQLSWLVTDPAGLGVSEVLRGSIVTLAKNRKHGIDSLLKAVAGEAWHVEGRDLGHFLITANRVATEWVATKLGDAATLLPAEVVKRLADADSLLENARGRSTATTKLVEDFLGNAYAALEALLGWISSLYPDPSVAEALDASAHDNAQLLQQLAVSLGFTISGGTKALLSVTRDAVVRALEHDARPLSGRFAACLLAANANREHPFWSLAQRDPGALEFIARLGRMRINASHNTDAVPTVDMAIEARERLYSVLGHLVGVGPSGVPAPARQSLAWGADLLLRIRTQAEHEVQMQPDVEAFPKLRTRLIEMHHAAIIVRLLARDTDTPRDALQSRLRDFVVAAAIAVEALITEIETRAPSRPEVAAAISDDRKENSRRVTAVATSLGFAVESGSLLKWVTHAQTDRIRSAAQGKAETMSAMVVAQVLSAELAPAHPLRGVARRAPNFLMDVARVAKARGHGDEVHISADEADGLEKLVSGNVLAVLKALEEEDE